MKTKSVKQTAKKESLIIELLPTEKKDEYGSDLFHLYLNGKTDKTDYALDGEAYIGTWHEVRFAKLLMSVPCRCFPHDIYTDFELGSPIIIGLINSQEFFNIVKVQNKFILYLGFEEVVNGSSDLITINYLKVVEMINKELKKDKKNKLNFETEADQQISINVSLDETLQEVINKITLLLNKAMNNVKIHLQNEVKKLEKELINS